MIWAILLSLVFSFMAFIVRMFYKSINSEDDEDSRN